MSNKLLAVMGTDMLLMDPKTAHLRAKSQHSVAQQNGTTLHCLLLAIPSETATYASSDSG